MQKIRPVMCLLVLVAVLACVHPDKPEYPLPEPRENSGSMRIHNPYQDVDWAETSRFKANLQTHTTHSDGWYSPARIVQEYRDAGYGILSITDHNTVTWPWDFSREEPYHEGMLLIIGSEISDTHHLGSFFSDYTIDGSRYRPFIGSFGSEKADITIEEVLRDIGARNGIAVLFHPGRYGKELEFYTSLYRTFPHAVGMEVINRDNRYPHDDILWDAVLTELMPERPVWGFANDDLHRLGHLGHAFSIFPLEQHSTAAFRTAMENGAYYFSHGETAPRIHEIRHDSERHLLTIFSDYPEDTVWISNGRIIHRGPSIAYREPGKIGSYLRAEIRSDSGTTFTNPFGVYR